MRLMPFVDVRSRARGAALAVLMALLAGCAAPVPPRQPLDDLIPPSAELVAVESPAVALQRAAARADALWPLAVVPSSTSGATWSVTSARDGFLYVLRADVDGHGLSLVYPRAEGETNRLRAGSRFELSLPWPGQRAGDAAGMVFVGAAPLRAGDLLLRLGLGSYAAAACLRNLGSDDCPSTAAGAGSAAAPWPFGAALLPAGP
jgi:hypothetical protein